MGLSLQDIVAIMSLVVAIPATLVAMWTCFQEKLQSRRTRAKQASLCSNMVITGRETFLRHILKVAVEDLGAEPVGKSWV